MMRYVLDTDHLSLLQRGYEPLRSRVEGQPTITLAITIISVEEQLRGRLAQVNKAKTTAQLEQSYKWFGETFDSLARFDVLSFSDAASRIYDELRRRRIRTGTQDLRIAAIVLAHESVLVTRNTQDFVGIAELRIEDWMS